MRMQDILNMVKNYMGLGLVVLALTVIILLVGYFGIYKKLCKGKKQIDFKILFWWFVLIFYLFVVLSVTLFRRSGFWNGQVISFFYSYKDAWISASASAWRNIILNILMFVPLGFWLPIGKEKFRTFWKTYLVGFVLTVGIEFFQLIFSLGLFEVADVFNNTLGTMIGYGIYALFFKKKKMLYQIPIVLTVLMFATIFVAYEKQELGNLSIESISPYKKDTFLIETKENYSQEKQNLIVYQTNTISVEETEKFAKEFFENLGTTLDESRNDIYEDSALYWAKDSYSLWVYYKGGTYNMTDFDTLFPSDENNEPNKVVDADEETILEALSEYGIKIPEGADFSYDTDMGYTISVDKIEKNGVIYDGTLVCEYYDNGKFSDIRNNIKQLEEYKEFEICSEQEAYEQILEGKFVCALDSGSKIELGEVTLTYMMDTKGFYQPIYNFKVEGDSIEYMIQIPAIK